MSLQSVLHLQAMLERTQKNVSVRKFSAFLVGDQIAIRQATQDDQSVWNAQPAVASSMSKLQSLGDKFNLAYAADSELYVQSTRRAAKLAIDFLLRQSHAGKRVFHR